MFSTVSQQVIVNLLRRININRLLPALHLDVPDEPAVNRVFDLLIGVFGKQQGGLIFLGDTLEPRRQIDRVAHDRIVLFLLGADVPDRGLAGVDADTDLHLMIKSPLLQRFVDLFDALRASPPRPAPPAPHGPSS